MASCLPGFLPADLRSLTATQLLAAVPPVLPSLRKNLDMALDAICSACSDEEMDDWDRE